MDLRFLSELTEHAGPLATVYLDTARLAVIDRYEKAAGRGDGFAVEGVGPVLAAPRAEAVDTLLLDAGVHRDGTAWISREPAQVAEERADPRAAGSAPIDQVPVDAAMLRAAAGSGAAFVPIGGGRIGLVGRPLDDGLGRCCVTRSRRARDGSMAPPPVRAPVHQRVQDRTVRVGPACARSRCGAVWSPAQERGPAREAERDDLRIRVRGARRVDADRRRSAGSAVR